MSDAAASGGVTGAAPQPAVDFAAGFRRLNRRRVALIAVLLCAAALSLLADLASGPSAMGLAEVLQGLFDPAGMPAGAQVILWEIRLPYALMALGVGAALGLAGAETQTVLNNPLASPYTLGISWAAILGATVVIVLQPALAGLSQAVLLPAAAFLGAALAGLLILALAVRFGSNTETIILFGIALLFSCSATISLLQFVANAEAVQQSVLWSMGSLTRSTWTSVGLVAAALVVVLPLTLGSAWRLTLLRAGDEQARSAGVNLHRLRLFALLRVSLLTGAAVAFVGAIGFVGLVAPHVARLLLGEDHRFYLPGALLTGAVLMSLASIASKSILPGVVIPVGIVTSLVGVPVFVALVVLRRRRG